MILSRSLLMIAALGLMACNSPILNHSNAGETLNAPLTESDAACPIALPKAGLCASWSWESLPNDSDEATATIRFWQKGLGTESGPYVDPGHVVSVKLWMPAMGHGSSPVTTTAKLDAQGAPIPGVFEASRVFFVMPGAWEIWLKLKNGTAISDQGKLDVTL